MYTSLTVLLISKLLDAGPQIPTSFKFIKDLQGTCPCPVMIHELVGVRFFHCNNATIHKIDRRETTLHPEPKYILHVK